MQSELLGQETKKKKTGFFSYGDLWLEKEKRKGKKKFGADLETYIGPFASRDNRLLGDNRATIDFTLHIGAQ